MISMEELMQSRVKLLGSTALAAAALVLAPTAVSADQALEKRIKALEKAGGMSVTRSKKTMKLVVNGHVNRAIVLTDNGTASGFTHVTSNFSRTRVRWIGTGKISDDLSVKTNIELGNQSSVATGQDLGDNGDHNGDALDERHIEFQITSKSLGKIYMGQGISGSESIAEQDLSGTGIVSLNGNGELIGGGETFQASDAASGHGTVGDNFNNFDGLGRRDRIRYDTPKFGGFQVTTSHSNQDSWDLALRYGGSIGGTKVKAAVGTWENKTNGEGGVAGSISVLLPMGVSLTVGASDRSDDDGGFADESEWRYAKVGYKFKGSSLGQTRLYVEYNQNDDTRAANSEAEYWGMGVVQIVEPLGAELYGSFTNYTAEEDGVADADDITQLVAGARFKF
jgi:hypothetical protein